MKKNLIYRLLSLYFKRKIKAFKNIKAQGKVAQTRSNTIKKENTLTSNVQLESNEITVLEKKKVVDPTRVLFQNIEDVNILLADDNKANQSLIGSLLQKEHYNFDVVKNGWEAICAFEEGKYDLILMAINMPIMNGDEATIAIRKLNNQVPIIALTEDICYDLFKDKLNLGFTDVLSKPLDKALLIRTIKNLIDLRRSTLQTQTAFDSLTWAS